MIAATTGMLCALLASAAAVAPGNGTTLELFFGMEVIFSYELVVVMSQTCVAVCRFHTHPYVLFAITL